MDAFQRALCEGAIVMVIERVATDEPKRFDLALRGGFENLAGRSSLAQAKFDGSLVVRAEGEAVEIGEIAKRCDCIATARLVEERVGRDRRAVLLEDLCRALESGSVDAGGVGDG